MEYDIDKLIVEMDFNSLKMASCKNGLLLTNQEVEVLRRYDIDYESCSSLKDVLFKIEDVLSLEVIDDAITPTSPIKPNKMMNIAISAVLAVMIGLFIIFLMEALDNKIKKPEDIEKCIGIPVLGTIYEYETNNKNNKNKLKKKIA